MPETESMANNRKSEGPVFNRGKKGIKVLFFCGGGEFFFSISFVNNALKIHLLFIKRRTAFQRLVGVRESPNSFAFIQLMKTEIQALTACIIN